MSTTAFEERGRVSFKLVDSGASSYRNEFVSCMVGAISTYEISMAWRMYLFSQVLRGRVQNCRFCTSS